MERLFRATCQQPEFESFTNYHPTPIRFGMTLGELAQMYNVERKIGARLRVIPMQGWLRGDWFDSTGIVWINTSPNLRSVNEAELYTGVALVEGTNVSVGRGTDTPFEVMGAPWIDARAYSDYMNARLIPGRALCAGDVYAGERPVRQPAVQRRKHYCDRPHGAGCAGDGD